jgi:hypothetical protein
MASTEEIASVKLYLPSDAETEYGWDDTKISNTFDTAGSLNRTLRAFWNDVANKYLLHVDISESGSSRSMGVYYDRALERIKYYDGLIAEEDKNEQTNRIRISFGQINRE